MFIVLTLALSAAPPAVDPDAEFQRLRNEMLRTMGRYTDQAVILKFAPRFFAHAERYHDHPSAIEALLDLASWSRNREGTRERALDLAFRHYVRSPVVVPFLRFLGMRYSGDHKDFLLAVAEKNPDKRVRALAWRAVINGHESYLRDERKWLANEKFKKAQPDFYAQTEATVARRETEIAQARAKLRSADLAGALPDLAVGARAPATVAIDLDRKKVSLADHKGKVILLDFWFTNCGPCVKMIPMTNALVRELKGKPFVPISVSRDDDPQRVIAFKKTREMLGESWWVGHGSRVLETWDVEVYPTVYVIDHEGVIRHHQTGYDVKDETMPKLIRKLVERAEAK